MINLSLDVPILLWLGNTIYVRKVTHTDKKNRQDYYYYYIFKLVESVRTERGLQQRAMLNLESEFTLRKR